ncbi:dihydrodipicolinate synthase family protein [Lysinibacillus odysseyi]|uniref:Dihydrodipicolinate synthetase n=1 Tax=Lysinibacillus odysseyi 34hs-1 = NBRC 100172 TaxID=1220589 RepID=A0A0A3J3R7_9BACI|nr:dihydrodipicolinate synthase family protein [Lysinibacillus odysseyi]KGR81692.1 dihydrodipicolinate synthetase [Lysinibacillus odysseyi 34hs-1 = NBRC 100172]
MLDTAIKEKLLTGSFIPAHPLALLQDKSLDEASQRRLTRYYIASGADGIAVGVHTTQFEIHDDFSLYEKVLRLAHEEIEKHAKEDFIKVAGVSGDVAQAKKEAQLAKELGYHLVLLSNNGLSHVDESQLLERAREVASIIPVIGFYLQPAVGGRIFSKAYWEQFCEIPHIHAIKAAPFNRYLTIDVARAIMRSSRADEIALYTGNDDSIIHDLFTVFEEEIDGVIKQKRVVGGLLGHWAVWTSKAVELFHEIKREREYNAIDVKWMKLAQQITHANAAFFDAGNEFKGSIAGINEVLKRQGMLTTNICISEKEVMSDGQAELIDEVYALYPHLHDDKFVHQFLVKETLPI